jgi:hypothetical protein
VIRSLSRRRLVLAAGALACLTLLAPADTTSSESDPPPMSVEPGPTTQRTVPNHAFGAGERLVYNVEFMGITAGQATLEIPEVVDLGHARVYRLISESRTSSFFDRIYSVRNRYESFIDVERLCSWRYVEQQHERGRIRDRISDYDQLAHTVTVTRFPVQRKGAPVNTSEPTVETAPIPPFAQDVLSAMYYLRTQDLRVGQVHSVPTASGTKSYELIVRIPQMKQIKTPLGRFQTLELIPELKYEGLFIQRGKMYVYVTNDAQKTPVMMRSKVAVGSFKAVLAEKHVQDLVTESTGAAPR